MLASRLLSILMLLQARGRLSASELARTFEVSVRTIHRDIDQLSAAGVPVYAERGRSGGFALLDGYRTRLTGFTQSEAEAIFLAGLPGPAAQLGLADILATARLKLMAALPAQMQPERIAARFHLDPVGWFRGTDPEPTLKIVAQAVWDERYLKLRYRNSGEIYGRKLGPLGLVLKSGVWYLVAQSGKSIRTYRVAQIVDAEVTDEPFARPTDFDIASHWENASRAYEAGLYREQADVRLSPRGIGLLDMLGPHVAQAARSSARPVGREGWMRCSLPIETTGQGIRELMRLGEDVEVLGPPELRAEMLRRVDAMSQQYGGKAEPKPAGRRRSG
jgi:predicted DNA-binding transcriptional regulator YafY